MWQCPCIAACSRTQFIQPVKPQLAVEWYMWILSVLSCLCDWVHLSLSCPLPASHFNFLWCISRHIHVIWTLWMDRQKTMISCPTLNFNSVLITPSTISPVAQSVQWVATRWITRKSAFNSWQGQKFLLFAATSRLALGPSQSRSQWVLYPLPPWIKQPGHATITHLPESKPQDGWTYILEIKARSGL
jgi:hypothetical protein